ncbi:nucleotidyltransferase domain-containing protein [Frigoribacterium endophyticum]|uniref:nucleotidyltransferase domain-containing protein n=1 Tax=Frigoribacterium endophyticum TaxID=1522176 RepID=UPI003C7AD435
MPEIARRLPTSSVSGACPERGSHVGTSFAEEIGWWGDNAPMTTRLKGRRREAARVVDAVSREANVSSEIQAVALVGSYARGAERMASDVDLVLLAADPDALAASPWFVRLLPGAELVRSRRWGPVRERRYRLCSGLFVELGIAPVSWADLPLDAGTRRVLSDGHRVLYDEGLLSEASKLVRSDTAAR